MPNLCNALVNWFRSLQKYIVVFVFLNHFNKDKNNSSCTFGQVMGFIVTFVDVLGFLPGTGQEHGGIVR